MVAKHISMAEELLNAVTEPFTKVVCKLHDSRVTSIENFKIKKADLMKCHSIDSTLLLSPDKKKPTTTGIFEVFANKAGLNATELKETLIDWMCDKRTELGNCMAIALNQSKLNFAEWLPKNYYERTLHPGRSYDLLLIPFPKCSYTSVHQGLLLVNSTKSVQNERERTT